MSKNSEKVTRVLCGDPAQDDQPPRIGPDTVDVLSIPDLQHLGDSGPPAGEAVRRQIPAGPDRRVGGMPFVAFSEHPARMGQPPDSGRGSAGPQETCPQAALRMMFMPESDPGLTRALFRAGARVRGMFAPNHTPSSARYVRCCILGGQWWAMRIVPSTDQGPSADARPGQPAWPPFPGWARPGWRRPRRRLTWEWIMPIQKKIIRQLYSVSYPWPARREADRPRPARGDCRDGVPELVLHLKVPAGRQAL